MSSTLNTIAKDVKIQIEFNPAIVAEYRLIGYENRQLKQEDFNNDKVDAGEIGAGHTVTALYELALVGSAGQRLEAPRYSNPTASTSTAYTDELAFLRLRYKRPDSDVSQLLETPIKRQTINNMLARASDNLHFAAAVAAFGQLLRGGTYLSQFAYDDILQLVQQSKGQDAFGYRSEFIQLVNLAKSLSTNTSK
jgi:Ca-activated chloride channel family protein